MLQTKSILTLKEESDGIRISVMSRHTLNDGKTPHPQINQSSYDVWPSIFAPPTELIKEYYKKLVKEPCEKKILWINYEKKYLEYIRQPAVSYEVKNLARFSLDKIVTLLCIEDTPEYCHRRLLAEECKKYQPELELNIK
jgi:uncharacterized protein YeaO (DUF488 family)